MDMRKKKEFLIRSLDTSNAIQTSLGDSLNINPTVWEGILRDYQEETLVLTPFAEYQDFTGSGKELIVTIDENPGAAEALDEQLDVPISTISTRQVTHEPTEYGAAYQLTKKQAKRGFFDAVQNAVKKLGFMTGLKKDNLAAAALYAAADSGDGEVIFAAGAADRSALVALGADGALTLKDILKSRAIMQANLYQPSVFFVTHFGEAQLLDNPAIQRAADFGDTRAIQEGFVGRVFGVNIVRSDSVATAEDGAISRNIMLGTTKTGESAFGHGVKSTVEINRDYHALGRYWDIVADEDYDFQVYHEKAVHVIESHNSGFTA